MNNPNPPAHMPSCSLINLIDQPSTSEADHFDFYLMHRTMYKLWLLEPEDERQRLDKCNKRIVAKHSTSE